jgi:DNA polymerase-1
VKKSIIQSPDEFREWMSRCKYTFALDTETTGLKHLYLEIVGFSISDGVQACYVHLWENEHQREILDILDFYIQEAKLVIMHNAPYDMSVLYKYGIRFNDVACTQTVWHCINENLPSKSLKFLANRILGIPKSEIKEYNEVKDADFDTFSRYAMNDAIWTFDLYQKALPEIEQQGLQNVIWNVEMPFQHALMWLRINGVLVDKQLAKEELVRLRHLYYQLEDEMFGYLGSGPGWKTGEQLAISMTLSNWYFTITPRSRKVELQQHINFNSPDQMIRIIESMGIKIYETTKKGNKSIGKRFKERVKGTNDFIDKWIRYVKIGKLLSGFLEPFQEFIDYDGRIRASFRNSVAVTGRLSCSEPNLEQLPQNNNIANVRNLYISPPDSLLIVADYKQQELRVLAEESNDKTMRDELLRGDDLHQQCADATGLSRSEAKTISFGVPYGKTEYGFSKDLRCSVEEAKEYLDKYFAKYPSIATRIEGTQLKVKKDHWVANMNGRRRRFPNFKKLNMWAKKKCYRMAFNFLIQSASADMVKIACAKLVRNEKLKLINIIHDEVCIECPKSYIDEGVEFVKTTMESAMKMSLPIPVDLHIVDRYGAVEK